MADTTAMNEFVHERLDVYQAAIAFLVLADTVAGSLPRGRAYLADQLRRASTSISFNIAEGAGEYAPADKARFYRIARRSATESAAILDACRLLSLIDVNQSQQGRALLLRVVAMLTAMVVKLSGSGSPDWTSSGAPTDPDVPISGIRLFSGTGLAAWRTDARCAASEAGTAPRVVASPSMGSVAANVGRALDAMHVPRNCGGARAPRSSR